jgi:hypothetical protein
MAAAWSNNRHEKVKKLGEMERLTTRRPMDTERSGRMQRSGGRNGGSDERKQHTDGLTSHLAHLSLLLELSRVGTLFLLPPTVRADGAFSLHIARDCCSNAVFARCDLLETYQYEKKNR